MKCLAKTLAILLCSSWLSACVTEITGGPFREPTEEDKRKALSLYVQMAYRRIETKQYDTAMAALNRALELDKNSPLALNALGVAYRYQGENEKAEKAFRQAIREDKKFSQAHFDYGDFLYANKRYEEACEEFLAATQDDFYDKRASAFYNLGNCYRETNQLDLAEKAYTRSLELQPKDNPVMIELADLGLRRKAYPQSKEYFDRYAKLSREAGQPLSARALWLGIQLERVFGNRDKEASFAMQLKNNFPYSAEYLEYQSSLKK